MSSTTPTRATTSTRATHTRTERVDPLAWTVPAPSTVAPPEVFLPPEAFVGWLVPDAVSPARCAALLADARARGFARTGERYPAGYRDNDRLVFDDAALAGALFAELRARLPATLVEGGARWELCGLNPRFRACRYTGGQAFCIHRDGPFAPADDVRSFLTVQLYLDDDPARAGGHTRFYADPRGATEWARIAPRAGAAIVFDHRAWHDGEAVTAGIKHVLRTDAMYRRAGVGASPSEGAHASTVIGVHRGYAWRALPLRDGSIASAGRDGTVRRWTDAGEASCLDLARGSVTCLVATEPPDAGENATGSVLCAGTRAGTIVVVETDRIVATAELPGAITRLALAHGTLVATTSTGEVHALAPHTAQIRWSTRAHDGWAWGIAALAHGALSCGADGRVVRIDRDGRARVWAELGSPLRALATPSTTATTAITSATRTVAIVGDERGWLYWLGREGRVTRMQRAHGAAITSIAVAGDTVISGGEDGRVMRWRTDAVARGGEVLAELADFVTSVAVDARGDIIIAGYDGAIRRVG